MTYLIIGGTSGLGLCLARKLFPGNSVHITGRSDPKEAGIFFHELNLSNAGNLDEKFESLLTTIGHIDCLIYAAGFYQEGLITDLSPAQIREMLSVGQLGAIYSTRQVLLKQGELSVFVAITSTSQYTPRLEEPVYTAVKAGLGAYANSLSLDPRVRKTLVAGPAGMKTSFYGEHQRDTTNFLDPEWVADQTIGLLEGDYKYMYARILREPARVEINETR